MLKFLYSILNVMVTTGTSFSKHISIIFFFSPFENNKRHEWPKYMELKFNKSNRMERYRCGVDVAWLRCCDGGGRSVVVLSVVRIPLCICNNSIN